MSSYNAPLDPVVRVVPYSFDWEPRHLLGPVAQSIITKGAWFPIFLDAYTGQAIKYDVLKKSLEGKIGQVQGMIVDADTGRDLVYVGNIKMPVASGLPDRNEDLENITSDQALQKLQLQTWGTEKHKAYSVAETKPGTFFWLLPTQTYTDIGLGLQRLFPVMMQGNYFSVHGIPQPVGAISAYPQEPPPATTPKPPPPGPPPAQGMVEGRLVRLATFQNGKLYDAGSDMPINFVVTEGGFLLDKDTNIILGSKEGKLYRYNETTGKFEYWQRPSFSGWGWGAALLFGGFLTWLAWPKKKR